MHLSVPTEPVVYGKRAKLADRAELAVFEQAGRPHSHSDEVEHFAVISGAVLVFIAGASRPLEVQAGDPAVVIPPGVTHHMAPMGGEAATALIWYV